MSTIIITVDSKETNRLFASTVRAMRRSLDITEAQLARASGIARQRIEAIEAGGATTGAERHDITVALASAVTQPCCQGFDHLAAAREEAGVGGRG